MSKQTELNQVSKHLKEDIGIVIMDSSTIKTGNEVIYLNQHDKEGEDRVTTLDNDILRDTLSTKLRLNGGGRILKVEVTLSHNVYRHKDELNQTITFLPREDK